MRLFFTKLFIFCLSLFSITTAAYAAETYTIDPMHTYVAYRINHLGFSTQTGKWMASGKLVLDKDNPSNSKVNATIRVGDMITGIDELNKHLKSKLFFNVAQYPVATFVSDKVEVTGNDTAKVTGMLTLHGVSKPVTLDVKLVKAGVNPVSNKTSVGFSATTKLKRSDFGINTLLPALGDDVDLDIGVEANKTA